MKKSKADIGPCEAPASDEDSAPISRRALLSATGALGAALATGLAAADDHQHSHADHAPRHPVVFDAANDCSDKSQLCLAHCLVTFQEGDTTLARCAQVVYDTISICDALAAQVATNSSHIPGMAAVCREACVACETECRKHEDDHLECKNCADACAALIDAIDKM